MLVLSVGGLYAYVQSPRTASPAHDMLINGILMTVMGFFIGGPSNLISAAVSADLGRQPEIRGFSRRIRSLDRREMGGFLCAKVCLGARTGEFSK